MTAIWSSAAAGSNSPVAKRKKPALQIELEFWLVRFVVATLEWSPLPVANWLGNTYARLLDRALPRLRRVAMINLEMIYPHKPLAERKRIADGVYRSIGRILVSFARFPSIHEDSVRDWIRYEGYEHFELARQRGRGVLFATAHLGNWELSAFSHCLMARPMHVVVRPLDNPKIDALVERRRGLSGNYIIAKQDFVRPMLRALRDNEAVGILIDQNSALENGVFVDFFGVPACVNTGFAKLAARSGAAVIPGFALWNEREKRYVLKFYPIVEMTGDEVEDTRAIQHSLERAIAAYPDQWLWIHRRWKTRPEGQPAIY
jgi:KDO2-lipid IV(A) lauroyltransferase